MSNSGNKTKLSKSILEMKFMKRSKEKVIQELEVEESHALYGDAITERMKHDKSLTRYIMEPSIVQFENLAEGRFSYHGMNPHIERIMEAERIAKEESVQPKEEAEVSDEEMADRYSSLVGTVSRKFAPKRSRSDHVTSFKKRKFVKPEDD